MKNILTPLQSYFPEAIVRLVDNFKTWEFFFGLKSDYARLKAKTHEWQKYISENEIWEIAIGDGLIDSSN